MGKLSFYHEGPLFGLEIGYSSVKLVQLDTQRGKKPVIKAYGISFFAPEAVQNGVISSTGEVARSITALLQGEATGKVTARRVACALPTARVFSRPMRIPVMQDKDVAEAVRLEAEQYIPVPNEQLYIEHEITVRDDQNLELMVVAVPRIIVDSYLALFSNLGLEVVALEPAINASSRLVSYSAPPVKQPAVLIDIGAVNVNLAILDKLSSINSTLTGGGEVMTQLIAKQLKLTMEQAQKLKFEHGLNGNDHEYKIVEALQPILQNLTGEIKKIVRYYEERSGEKKIAQLVLMGGGAGLAGLLEYLEHEVQLPVTILDPWQGFDFSVLPAFSDEQKPVFLTAAGEASLKAKEAIS